MGSSGNALQLTSQNSKDLILDNFQLNQLNLANIAAVQQQQQQPPPLDPKKQQQSQAKKRRKKNDADPNSNDSNIEKSPLPTIITSNEIINSQQQQHQQQQQQQQQQHEIQKDMHYFDNFNQSNSFKLNQNIGSSFLNLDTNMNNFNQQHHMHPPPQQQQQPQFQQHANTAQKNFVVNLNQPPKIIQISNQVPMNLIGHQQQQQQQQKNSPILLYQMQHNQANKICNQQPQQLQQQQQQHMPQFKLIDDQRGKLENNSSSEHVIQTQNIMLNTSNQLEQNSGMLLENCEFINSTKANLARSTSQKYLSQNLNFEENIKPDQQSNEHKNDSNIRVYLSQQLQQKPMLINQQDTGKPNEFHIIQQHQQPQPQQQQQQYVDNNSNQQHQQAPIQLQLFAQPGQRFDNNFYNENNSQNSQTPAVSYMPIQIVSIDQPANHSSQNTNTNNNNIIINNNNNNNASSSVSKADEVLDHIDIIINEVAAGSGTIPYSSDFDDEESKINLLVIRVEYQIIKFYLIIS